MATHPRAPGPAPDEDWRALDEAAAAARAWLSGRRDRPVPARVTAEEVAGALGGPVPEGPSDPADVVDALAVAAEPGLTTMNGGSFFGFVIGGTHPAALGADWLVSTWDQNSALRTVTPAVAAVEDVAARWVLDLLDLPRGAALGFTTGATTANLTCLAAARDAVLERHGWDVSRRGLAGGPAVRVLVGEESHTSVQLALRVLGLGAPERVPADAAGRVRADALAEALDAPPDGGPSTRPTVVVLQAGNIHSGAFDPVAEAVEVAHRQGAWAHVDGAFGLFARAVPALSHLVTGIDRADSWATDAHKTLNVPYDCGIAVVADPTVLRRAMGAPAEYLVADDAGDPYERVPEISRRARGVPVWAVLRSLGRSGVADLVEGFCRHATDFAAGLSAMPGVEVLNEVVFTQVCASFGSDERTRGVVSGVLADGATWMTGSRWHDREVLRVSVCDRATTSAHVDAALDAVRRVLAGMPAGDGPLGPQ